MTKTLDFSITFPITAALTTISGIMDIITRDNLQLFQNPMANPETKAEKYWTKKLLLSPIPSFTLSKSLQIIFVYCNTSLLKHFHTRRSLEVKYAPRTYLCLVNQNLPQGSWYLSKRYDFYATHAIL